MLKNLLFQVVIFYFSISMFSQNIGINSTGATPNAAAMLDIDVSALSTKTGLLIPRVTATEKAAMNPLPAVAQGLVVYQTDGLQGFYYNTSTTTTPSWSYLSPSTAGWSTTGNTGTNVGTNFMGTTDAQPLMFKVNNNTAGYIDYATPFSTGFGYQTLNANIGTNNSAFGYQALLLNTTGTNNTAIGTIALTNNTTGSFNTAIGRALQNNNTGVYDVAVGEGALGSNTGGSHNIAIGKDALGSNTTGDRNVAMGTIALSQNTTGTENTSVGAKGLSSNNTGGLNSAFGSNALFWNSIGNYNSALGAYSMNRNISGNDNTASGYAALYNTTTGNGNTGIGENALSTNTTGSNNTAIGYNADVTTNNLTNATAIGYNAVVAASNSLVLGNGANVGIGISVPTEKLDVRGNGYFNQGSTTKLTIAGTRNGGNVAFNNTTGSGHAYLDFQNTDAPNTYVSARIESIDRPGNNDGDLRFYTTNNTTLAEAMNISNVGNVGIGTIASDKLHVVGKIRMVDGNQAAGYVPVSDANGTMTWTNPTSLSITETDPQVSSTTTNYIPKWNGTALVDGLAFDNGTNIGIGTTAPGYKLDVNGSVNSADNYYFTNSSGTGTTNPPFRLDGSADKLYVIAESNASGPNGTEIRLRTAASSSNAVDRVIIDRNGSVGIGTTAPGYPLDVNGSVNSADNYYFTNTSGTGTTNPPFRIDGSGDKLYVIAESNASGPNGTEIRLRTAAAASPAVDRLTIDKNGNVGISTTAPTQKLDVAGTTRTTNFQMTASPTANYILRSDASGNGSWVDPNTLLPTGTNGQTLRNNAGTWVANSLLYNDGTNVGIGTTAPGYPLDVNGSVNSADNYYFTNTSGTGTTNPSFRIDGSADKLYVIAESNASGPNGTEIRLRTAAAASNAIDRLTIDKNGNVGIATTSPTSTLLVNGAFATTVKTAQAAGTNDPDNTAAVWIYSSGTGTITLPTASTCSGRRYVIVNQTGAARTTSSFIDLTATSVTTLANNTSIEVISDGTNWRQIK